MKGLIVLTLALNAGSPFLAGATLDPEALRVWNDYVTAADLRMQPRLRGQVPFLWTDESADRRRRVDAGETVIAPIAIDGFKNAPNALIHHWIGAVLIPHGTLQQLAGTLHAYDRYKEFFRPFIAESRFGASTASGQEFSLIFQYRTMFGTFVYEARYATRDFPVDDRRRYSIANTTLVRQIEGYGTSWERPLPPGSGAGFVWRLHTIARYQQRDNGVYLELEALALTRNIPGALRWAVAPLVKRMSMNSMEAALLKTRSAVRETNPVADLLAAKPRADVTPSGSSK
jgi:hypothetical protein